MQQPTQRLIATVLIRRFTRHHPNSGIHHGQNVVALPFPRYSRGYPAGFHCSRPGFPEYGAQQHHPSYLLTINRKHSETSILRKNTWWRHLSNIHVTEEPRCGHGARSLTSDHRQNLTLVSLHHGLRGSIQAVVMGMAKRQPCGFKTHERISMKL